MAVLEYDGVEVDYCFACEGIWLDAGELELLFGDPEACHALLEAGGDAKPPKEETRRCPICDAKMRKAVSSSATPVTYDRCPAGDGLWFDAGELAAVLKESETFAQSEIAAFLGQVFSGEDAPDKG